MPDKPQIFLWLVLYLPGIIPMRLTKIKMYAIMCIEE